MGNAKIKRYRKGTYIISVEQLIEWKVSLGLEDPFESKAKVVNQIDDILTSLEVDN